MTPIWTQTPSEVTYVSDDYDNDSDSSSSDKKNRKKRGKFKMVNKKLDFSHVQSRTDSNYGKGDGHAKPIVLINSSEHPNEDQQGEVDRLKYLLAEVSVLSIVFHVRNPRLSQLIVFF